MKRGGTIYKILDESKSNTWRSKLFAVVLAIILITFIFWVFYRTMDYYGALEPLETVEPFIRAMIA